MGTTAFLSRNRARMPDVLFVLISALYFADTTLRASLKTFWFDEIYTVYLCRLPSFHATWAAVLHGSDFNPPLLYLLTRGANHLFGEGLIATRLPGILGFWILGLCLYSFTSRRLGRMVGAVAALAPVFTLAHNYAYEARAHGLVLAWCGLMLLCWQRSRDQSAGNARQQYVWTLGFALSFLGALLTHVYAIYLAMPFGLVEVVAVFRRRRPSVSTCAAIVVPIAVVAPLYLRMVRTFHSINSWGGLPLHNFILGIFGQSLVLMLLAVALTPRKLSSAEGGQAQPATGFTLDECIVAYGLLLLPIIGGLGVLLSHGPYFDRYFLGCTVGFALVFAQSVGARGGKFSWYIVTAMLVLIAGDIALAIHAYRGGDMAQIEPASHFRFSRDPARPLERDVALRQDTSNLDVLVTEDHNFLSLFFYAPPELKKRLVFGAPEEDDFILVSDRRLAKLANLEMRTATYAEFFATHKEFLVYSSNIGMYNGSCGDCFQPFLDAGYTLRSVKRDPDSLLEHFAK